MANFEVSLNPDVVGLKESATLKINQKVLTMRSEGREVFHFGFGQSPFPVHPKIVEAMQKHAGEKDYLPTLGLLHLREQICSYYAHHFDYKFDPGRVLIGPGSKELIFQSLFVLEGPVIVPAPSWVSYGPQVNIRGKQVVLVPTQRKNNYKLTAGELRETCNQLPAGQKVLIINSPNNPTGQVYNDEEIAALSSVCQNESVVVISDEIYGAIDFTGVKKRGFPHYHPEGTIVTAGLSKSHSAGGYRLGFLAAPPKLQRMMSALSSLVSETFSAVSAPTQYAAVKAYSKDREIDAYLQECSFIHQAVGNYIQKRLTQAKVDCPKPEGAFYLFPSFDPLKAFLWEKHRVKTSDQLAEVLLEEEGIALLPGTDFYMEENSLTARMTSVDYNGEEVFLAAQKRRFKLDDEFVVKSCPHIKLGCDRIHNFFAWQ